MFVLSNTITVFDDSKQFSHISFIANNLSSLVPLLTTTDFISSSVVFIGMFCFFPIISLSIDVKLEKSIDGGRFDSIFKTPGSEKSRLKSHPNRAVLSH